MASTSKINNMKTQMIKTTQKLFACIILSVFAIATFAQDGLDIDVDLADDSPDIFERPVFWVAVAAVLIILALILRKKK